MIVRVTDDREFVADDVESVSGLDALLALFSARNTIQAVIVDLDCLGCDPYATLNIVGVMDEKILRLAFGCKVSQDNICRALRAGAKDVLCAAKKDDVIDLARIYLESDRKKNAFYSAEIIGDNARLREVVDGSLRAARQHLPVVIAGEKGTGKKHLADCMGKYLGKKSVFIDLSENPAAKKQIRVLNDWQKNTDDILVITDAQNLAEAAQLQLMQTKAAHKKTNIFLLVTSSVPVNGESTFWIMEFLRMFSGALFFLPPLEQRREDIAPLAHYFAAISKKSGARLGTDVIHALENALWPGNASELQEVVKKMIHDAENFPVRALGLPQKIFDQIYYRGRAGKKTGMSYVEAKDAALDEFHHTYLSGLLRAACGNLTVAAEMAGLDRSNFRKIIRKYPSVL